MAALQPILVSSSFLSRGISRPIFPVKTKGKYGCVASRNIPRIAATLKADLAMANTATPTDNQEVVRPLAYFPPDLWGDRFITLPFTDSEFESCSKQVEILKGTVKTMLMTSSNDPIENILMINSLFRLGVSYHLKNDIEDQLSHLFTKLPELMDNKDYDLRTTADIFQVFRSHGYKMSSEVFNKFKNGDGTFKEEVGSDIKGLISFFEASQWRLHGEVILDEALAFTKSRLESMANQLSTSYLADYIAKILRRPYHRGMPRLEAKRYISFYEKDESRNDILLKFAKYDFNLVQMLHQQELSDLSRWWKESNIESRFPYIRHRTVECFFYVVGMYFEPRFARARNIWTKWMMAFTLLDDTYDAYGLYEELKYFTKAFEKLDIRAVDEIPTEYLKALYETVMNIFAETKKEMSKEGRAYGVDLTLETVVKMVKYSDVHARCAQVAGSEQITFDEYVEIGMWSCGCIPIMALSLIGIEEADETDFEWMTNPDNKIVRASCILGRLYNDISTDEAAEKRGNISGRGFYMKQYGASMEETLEAYEALIEAGWKDVNEGWMRPWPVAKQYISLCLYFTTQADVVYREDDGYSRPEGTNKHFITEVFIDPIPLQE